MAAPERRPEVHFTVRSGWMNDPLGLTWHEGRYHLFYQYVPDSLEWQPQCQWGHAVSDDLLTWEERAVVLGPGEGDDGAWSGSVVLRDGHARMYYTAVSVPEFAVGRVRVASPRDTSWDVWDKQPGVVAELPPGVDATSFRDPFVFWDQSVEAWRMLVGASLADGHGGTAAILSYVDRGDEEWVYDGILAQRPSALHDPCWTGSLWECPQAIEVDGHHLLLASVWHEDRLNYVIYQEGLWEQGRFVPRGPWQRLSFGPSIYAAMAFTDRDGRLALMCWLRGVGGELWAGAQSLPYRLSWDDGRLVAGPHPVAMEEGPVQVLRVGETHDGDGWLVEHRGHDVRIVTSKAEEVLPASQAPAYLLVDTGTLEVWSDSGVFASPL